MCGICFCLSIDDNAKHGSSDVLRSRIKCRGPDGYQCCDVKIANTLETPNDHVYLHFESTLLALRGPTSVDQPLKDEVSGCILCWNGEAWLLDGTAVQGCDSIIVLDHLSAAVASMSAEVPIAIYNRTIARVLESIDGPYALVFYDPKHLAVLFARDPLGRRSLLTKKHGKSFLISSVPDDMDCWEEVEPGLINMIRIDLGHQTEVTKFGAPLTKMMPFPHCVTSHKFVDLVSDFNCSIPSHDVPQLSCESSAVMTIESYLRRSLCLRVKSIPVQCIVTSVWSR